MKKNKFMLKKHIKNLTLLSMIMLFMACHLATNKKVVNTIQNKDTVKAVVSKPAKKEAPRFLVPVDTIINKDTFKVLWYQSGLIKCFLNNVADSIQDADISWDIHDSLSQLAGGFNRIISPYDAKLQKILLNNNVVLVTLVDWKGRANLFLLNRAKNFLKFAKNNDDNPICTESGYVYVDLKRNIIIDHGGQDKYDHDKQADAGDDTSSDAPYWIYKYKIAGKYFVKTDLDTAFYNEFLKLDVDEPKDARAFYSIIQQRENWKRDKYTLHSH